MHPGVSIGVEVAGSLQYRSPVGRDFMPPRSLLLGNAGEHFECGHEHAAGDRCVAFRLAPEYFERLEVALADDAAATGSRSLR